MLVHEPLAKAVGVKSVDDDFILNQPLASGLHVCAAKTPQPVTASSVGVPALETLRQTSWARIAS